MTSTTVTEFPTARLEPVSKTIGGVTFEDPYAWLHADSEEALAFQWAQDAAAQQYLAGMPEIPALREATRAFFVDPLKTATGGQYRRLGGRWFSMGRAEDGSAAIRVAGSLGEEGRILIDAARLAHELGTDLAVSMLWWQPSPDGKHVAFSAAGGGAMTGEWRVVEVESGRLLPLTIPAPLFTGAQPGWLPDGSGFYLFDRAEDNRHRVRLFDLETGVQRGSEHAFDTAWIDEVVSGVLPQVSPRGRYVVGMSMPHEHVALVLGDRQSGEWRPFLPEGVAGECHGAWVDEDTYLAIVTDETPRGRVAAIPVATSRDRSTWRTLVRESDAVPRAVTVIGNRIVLCETADVSVRFRIFGLDGTPAGEVPVEPCGSSPIAFIMRRFEDSEELAFFHNTFARAGTTFHFDLGTGEMRVIGESGPLIEGLTVSQRFAASKDGTRVPYFVVHHADLDLSRPQPALISGYGGFNVAWLPTFLGPLEPFLRAGGVYLHANLRGGAEYGRDWYDGGRLHNKQNTFDDLFAVAEDAIAAGITSPERLAFKGDSNGGLLAGVAIVQRADLWRVVVAGVPLFDMMEPLPGDDPTAAAIRAIFFEDYGDPSNPEDAQVSYAYSPYHNIQDGVDYPAVLQVFGEKDLGCMPFHGRKFTARVQPGTTSNQPILMRVWQNTGHGSAEPEVAAGQHAEWLGFVMHHLGLTVQDATHPQPLES
jgi:prolyl oligopeptidase